MTVAPVAAARRLFVGAIRERRTRDRIIKRAREAGWLVHPSASDESMVWALGCDAGFPTLALARTGRMLLFVVVDGHTSPAHRAWMSALAQVVGVEVHVVTAASLDLIDRLLA